jgi:hypothetical protein
MAQEPQKRQLGQDWLCGEGSLPMRSLDRKGAGIYREQGIGDADSRDNATSAWKHSKPHHSCRQRKSQTPAEEL